MAAGTPLLTRTATQENIKNLVGVSGNGSKGLSDKEKNLDINEESSRRIQEDIKSRRILRIPEWNDNFRASPNDIGMIGMNTSTGALEIWDGTKFIVYAPTGTR